MHKTIVILSGKAGSGKDTFCNLMGPNWERIAIADSLKEVAAEESGLDIESFHAVGLKDAVLLICGKHQTPRDLLLTIGKERRDLDEDYWVNMVIDKIHKSNKEYFVITDWRFPNECVTIKEAFEGSNIRTVRIEGRTSLESNHESECALDDMDFGSIINNNSTLEALKEKARLLGAVMREESAVESVYLELRPKARNLCRKHVRNSSDLFDATQDALLNVLALLEERFDFTSSLWTFAYKCIYYNVMNFRRRSETFARTFYFSEEGTNDLEDINRKPPKAKMLGKYIDEALGTVSALDRRLFKLRHAGYKHKEIGKLLGITDNYSRKRFFGINRKLRRILKDLYLDLI